MVMLICRNAIACCFRPKEAARMGRVLHWRHIRGEAF